MNDNKLPWFPCEATALLGALASMKPTKHVVYITVLLRIYENGGACPDSIDALSTRTRINKRMVTEALAELFKEGRLYHGEGGIRNWKADEVVASSITLREKRKSAGADAANRRWKKAKEKQTTVHAKPNADPMRSDAHLHLQEQDSLFSNENRVPRSEIIAEPAKPKPKPKLVLVQSDWPDDFREQFWDAYPRHTEKKAAMSKLDGVRKSGLPWARFIAGVHRYRDHIRAMRTEEKYIKHPATWLNRGCWDDELPMTGGNGNEANRSGAAAGGKSGYANIAASIVRRQFADGELYDQQPATSG